MTQSDRPNGEDDVPPSHSQWHGFGSRRFAFAAILIAMAAGAGAYRLLANSWGGPERVQRPQAEANAPLFVRDGQRIIVPQGSPLRSRLVVANVLSKEVSRKLVLPAMVEAKPARTVKVLPPVAGRVVALKVELGARVTKDQELAVIDSSDLAQAYSDDEKARATLTLTKKALDRLTELEKSRAVAVKDREEAQNDYEQAVSEFDRANTRLRAIGVAAEPQGEPKGETRLLSLKSPVSGSVTDMQIATGAFLNDPTAEIMTIANLDSVWVTANVPEKDTSFVSTGQTVNVTFPAYPDQVFSGTVLFVSDVLEPDTRRTKVRIEFDNPNKALKPGMFANVAFAAPAALRLVIPTSALLMNNNSTSVFVEVEPWVFERREVETYYQEDDTAAIKSGLKPGEQVIVRGGVLLND